MEDDYWSLMYSHYNSEDEVVDNAKRQGFSCYVPRTTVRTNSGAERVGVAMFPRYVFWLHCLGDAWGALRSTRGVSYMFMSGERPARVRPSGFVDDLRRRENSVGLVELDNSRFRHNQSVVIDRGTFCFQRGVFDCLSDAGRARVLVDMMGGRHPVWVDEADLSAA